jgi:hypothetical protein
MATRHENSEPEWPPELAEFDPELWESKWAWTVARIRWARAQGYKHYRILPLIQAMVARPGGGEQP